MQRKKTAFLTRCAVFAAILCLLSPIAIPLGAIPLTLSLFALMLTALLLDWKAAMAAVGAYLLLGCCGLPVFSGGQGGAAVLIGPTGGYLWAYVPMAGLLSAFGRGKKLPVSFLAALGALALCYACGTAQYALLSGTGFFPALGVCVLPFLGFDLLKALCAVLLARSVEKRLPQ